MLIPVGGTYTVNSLEAFNLVKRINPKYVIPMHYKTKSCNINIESENKFLSYFLKEQISYVNKTVQYPLPNKVTVINF